MMLRLPHLIAVQFLLATAGLHAQDNPALVPFDATYQLSIKSISQGESVVELKASEQDTYLYRSYTHPTLIASWFRDETINEQSRFRITGSQLVPLAYEYRREQDDKTRLVNLDFDWESNKVVNSIAGDNWTMPVPDGALDKILVNLALMLDLQGGKSSVEYPVADGGILKTYRFEITGKERIETPAGAFDTVLVKRSRQDRQPTYLWCAPNLAYLPVRIERRLQHDMRYTSELKAYSESLQKW